MEDAEKDQRISYLDEKKGIFKEKLDIGCNDYDDLYNKLRETCVDPFFEDRYWRIEKIELIRNKELEIKYNKKKNEINEKGLSSTEGREVILFSGGSLKKCDEICKEGHRTGLKKKPVLGHPGLGVHFIHNYDILTRYLAFLQYKSSTHVVVYKAVLGRVKKIDIFDNKIQSEPAGPDAEFDCFVPEKEVDPRLPINEAMDRSYVYIYELDKSSNPVKYPRRILPYGLLTLERKPCVKLSSPFLAVECGSSELRWEVQGETRRGFRWSITKDASSRSLRLKVDQLRNRRSKSKEKKQIHFKGKDDFPPVLNRYDKEHIVKKKSVKSNDPPILNKDGKLDDIIKEIDSKKDRIMQIKLKRGAKGGFLNDSDGVSNDIWNIVNDGDKLDETSCLSPLQENVSEQSAHELPSEKDGYVETESVEKANNDESQQGEQKTLDNNDLAGNSCSSTQKYDKIVQVVKTSEGVIGAMKPCIKLTRIDSVTRIADNKSFRSNSPHSHVRDLKEIQVETQPPDETMKATNISISKTESQKSGISDEIASNDELATKYKLGNDDLPSADKSCKEQNFDKVNKRPVTKNVNAFSLQVQNCYLDTNSFNENTVSNVSGSPKITVGSGSCAKENTSVVTKVANRHDHRNQNQKKDKEKINKVALINHHSDKSDKTIHSSQNNKRQIGASKTKSTHPQILTEEQRSPVHKNAGVKHTGRLSEDNSKSALIGKELEKKREQENELEGCTFQDIHDKQIHSEQALEGKISSNSNFSKYSVAKQLDKTDSFDCNAVPEQRTVQSSRSEEDQSAKTKVSSVMKKQSKHEAVVSTKFHDIQNKSDHQKHVTSEAEKRALVSSQHASIGNDNKKEMKSVTSKNSRYKRSKSDNDKGKAFDLTVIARRSKRFQNIPLSDKEMNSNQLIGVECFTFNNTEMPVKSHSESDGYLIKQLPSTPNQNSNTDLSQMYKSDMIMNDHVTNHKEHTEQHNYMTALRLQPATINTIESTRTVDKPIKEKEVSVTDSVNKEHNMNKTADIEKETNIHIENKTKTKNDECLKKMINFTEPNVCKTNSSMLQEKAPILSLCLRRNGAQLDNKCIIPSSLFSTRINGKSVSPSAGCEAPYQLNMSPSVYSACQNLVPGNVINEGKKAELTHEDELQTNKTNTENSSACILIASPKQKTSAKCNETSFAANSQTNSLEPSLKETSKVTEYSDKDSNLSAAIKNDCAQNCNKRFEVQGSLHVDKDKHDSLKVQSKTLPGFAIHNSSQHIPRNRLGNKRLDEDKVLNQKSTDTSVRKVDAETAGKLLIFLQRSINQVQKRANISTGLSNKHLVKGDSCLKNNTKVVLPETSVYKGTDAANTDFPELKLLDDRHKNQGGRPSNSSSATQNMTLHQSSEAKVVNAQTDQPALKNSGDRVNNQDNSSMNILCIPQSRHSQQKETNKLTCVSAGEQTKNQSRRPTDSLIISQSIHKNQNSIPTIISSKTYFSSATNPGVPSKPQNSKTLTGMTTKHNSIKTPKPVTRDLTGHNYLVTSNIPSLHRSDSQETVVGGIYDLTETASVASQNEDLSDSQENLLLEIKSENLTDNQTDKPLDLTVPKGKDMDKTSLIDTCSEHLLNSFTSGGFRESQNTEIVVAPLDLMKKIIEKEEKRDQSSGNTRNTTGTHEEIENTAAEKIDIRCKSVKVDKNESKSVTKSTKETQSEITKTLHQLSQVLQEISKLSEERDTKQVQANRLLKPADQMKKAKLINSQIQTSLFQSKDSSTGNIQKSTINALENVCSDKDADDHYTLRHKNECGEQDVTETQDMKVMMELYKTTNSIYKKSDLRENDKDTSMDHGTGRSAGKKNLRKKPFLENTDAGSWHGTVSNKSNDSLPHECETEKRSVVNAELGQLQIKKELESDKDFETVSSKYLNKTSDDLGHVDNNYLNSHLIRVKIEPVDVSFDDTEKPCPSEVPTISSSANNNNETCKGNMKFEASQIVSETLPAAKIYEPELHVPNKCCVANIADSCSEKENSVTTNAQNCVQNEEYVMPVSLSKESTDKPFNSAFSNAIQYEENVKTNSNSQETTHKDKEACLSHQFASSEERCQASSPVLTVSQNEDLNRQEENHNRLQTHLIENDMSDTKSFVVSDVYPFVFDCQGEPDITLLEVFGVPYVAKVSCQNDIKHKQNIDVKGDDTELNEVKMELAIEVKENESLNDEANTKIASTSVRKLASTLALSKRKKSYNAQKGWLNKCGRFISGIKRNNKVKEVHDLTLLQTAKEKLIGVNSECKEKSCFAQPSTGSENNAYKEFVALHIDELLKTERMKSNSYVAPSTTEIMDLNLQSQTRESNEDTNQTGKLSDQQITDRERSLSGPSSNKDGGVKCIRHETNDVKLNKSANKENTLKNKVTVSKSNDPTIKTFEELKRWKWRHRGYFRNRPYKYNNARRYQFHKTKIGTTHFHSNRFESQKQLNRYQKERSENVHSKMTRFDAPVIQRIEKSKSLDHDLNDVQVTDKRVRKKATSPAQTDHQKSDKENDKCRKACKGAEDIQSEEEFSDDSFDGFDAFKYRKYPRNKKRVNRPKKKNKKGKSMPKNRRILTENERQEERDKATKEIEEAVRHLRQTYEGTWEDMVADGKVASYLEKITEKLVVVQIKKNNVEEERKKVEEKRCKKSSTQLQQMGNWKPKYNNDLPFKKFTLLDSCRRQRNENAVRELIKEKLRQEVERVTKELTEKFIDKIEENAQPVNQVDYTRKRYDNCKPDVFRHENNRSDKFSRISENKDRNSLHRHERLMGLDERKSKHNIKNENRMLDSVVHDSQKDHSSDAKYVTPNRFQFMKNRFFLSQKYNKANFQNHRVRNHFSKWHKNPYSRSNGGCGLLNENKNTNRAKSKETDSGVKTNDVTDARTSTENRQTRRSRSSNKSDHKDREVGHDEHTRDVPRRLETKAKPCRSDGNKLQSSQSKESGEKYRDNTIGQKYGNKCDDKYKDTVQSSQNNIRFDENETRERTKSEEASYTALDKIRNSYDTDSDFERQSSSSHSKKHRYSYSFKRHYRDRHRNSSEQADKDHNSRSSSLSDKGRRKCSPSRYNKYTYKSSRSKERYDEGNIYSHKRDEYYDVAKRESRRTYFPKNVDSKYMPYIGKRRSHVDNNTTIPNKRCRLNEGHENRKENRKYDYYDNGKRVQNKGNLDRHFDLCHKLHDRWKGFSQNGRHPNRSLYTGGFRQFKKNF